MEAETPGDDAMEGGEETTETMMYEAIEAIYVEAHDARGAPLPPDRLDDLINELEALAGTKPERRTLFTTDDSEVNMENTATLIAWEETTHVKAIQELLGKPGESGKTVGKWERTTAPHGLVSLWTSLSAVEVLIYAAGEGGRVQGWYMEDKTKETEAVSAKVEKSQVIKVLVRKLGVLPTDPVKRMTVLRAQQETIAKAISIAEGWKEGQHPWWMELRHPKLMASATGKAMNAAQSAQYTLVRTPARKDAPEMTELKVKVLDEMQRKPDGSGRGAIDRDMGLLAKGAVGGRIGKAYLSFEETTAGGRPSIAVMGMHLCVGDKLVRNHQEGQVCIRAMRRTVRTLPLGLKPAEELLYGRLAMRADEQCPLFGLWSIKNEKLSPCEGDKGCRGSLGSCRTGRYRERGTKLPPDVQGKIDAWKIEEREAAAKRMEEQRQAEQAVTEAYIGTKRPASGSPPGPRRSPRHQAPEAGSGGGKGGDGKGGGGKSSAARGGGGKGVGGKGGVGEGNGGTSRLGSSGGRGAAAASPAATSNGEPFRFSSSAKTSNGVPFSFGSGGGGGSGAPASSSAAGTNTFEAGLAVITAKQAETASVGLGQPKSAEAGREAAAAQVSEGAARVVTEGGAAGAASAELEEDEEMGEGDDEEALEGVPPEVLRDGESPSQTDMELYAAVLEEDGKKSAGRSSNGKKGAAGPGSAGAGGQQPPTPIPMGATLSITKARKNSPRNKNKGK